MNRFLIAFACTLLPLGRVSPARAQETSHTQAVYALLAAHHYTEAESAARQLLPTSAHDCGLNTMLALALRGQGQTKQAYEALRHTLTFCPQFVPALEAAGELAYSLHLPEATPLLAHLLEVRPDDPTAHAMLGALRARSGDCGEAVSHYAKAIEQVRRNAPALRGYARCLLTLERGKEALPLLQNLVELQDTAPNREFLAQLQWKLGDLDGASATLHPLLDEALPAVPAMLLAARIAETGNRTPEAIAWLRKAMATDPQSIQAYLSFAEISFAHGSYQVGIDFLDLGLRQCGADARLLLARGVLEAQLAKIDAALNDFRKAHQLDPKLSLTDDAEGVLFSQDHDLSAALALFKEKVVAQPNDPLLQYLYAEALSERGGENGQLSEAIAAVRRSIQIEPTYQPARDLLCVLLLRQGDFTAAAAEARKAIQLDSYDEVAIYQALQAERRLKHNEQTASYVRMLQDAKSHNQVAVTRYALEGEVP